jgi:peroxiredoxin
MSTAPRKPEASSFAARKRERLAALIVFAIGLPLVFIYARAMAEGEVRRREAPIRAMIGDDSYDRLARGERTEENYFGNHLTAPDFELRDKDGKPWRLRDQRGKTVVMNFWTMTCQPCVEELPSLLELAGMLQGQRDVEVVAITTDKDWSEVAALFPKQFGLKVLFDPEKKVVREKYGTRLFPETWIIDARGVVRLRVDGRRNWADALALDVIRSF